MQLHLQRTTRKFVTGFLTAGLLFTLAACGDDDDSTTTGSTAGAAGIEPASTGAAAPGTTAASTPDTTVAAPGTTAAGSAAGGAVTVAMKEFSIDMPDTLTAGALTVTLQNNGQFPHSLTVYKAASPDALPKTDIGAVDDAKAAGDIAGKIDKTGAGETATGDITLAAGTYVFACNIVGGPVSHFARGQVKTVTVA